MATGDRADPFHDHPHDHTDTDGAEPGHLAWHADRPGAGHLHVHGRAYGISADHHRPDPDANHPAVWHRIYLWLAPDDDH